MGLLPMFDSIIGIVSFCLAVAQAIILSSKSERRRTFAIVTTGLLILSLGVWGAEHYRHKQLIEDIADAVTLTMSANKYQTVDQIALHVNENRTDPVSSTDLQAAIDLDKARGYICSMNVNAEWLERQLLVRVYVMSGFGGAC